MPSRRSGFRFGRFEITPEAAELRRGGEPVHLEPRVLQLLLYLLENRERVVGKRELQDAVWKQAFVTENALTKAIARLRHALEDDAHAPRFVQTVHTLGYRFIAEVEELGSEDTPGQEGPRGPSGPIVSEEQASRSAPFSLLLLGAAAFLVVVGLTSPAGERRAGDRGTGVPIRSVAVLPLENLTGDPEQDYLASALHEALIDELARATPLRVIARRSVLRYGEADSASKEIAEELRVDAVVEGSVMRIEERVRLTARILVGPEDEHLWAGTFERPEGDLLTLTNELSTAIARQAGFVVAPGHGRVQEAPRAASPEVEESYLRARYFLNLGTVEGFSKARELFARAVELDPGFAPAHAGLGSAQFFLGFLGPEPHLQSAVASREATLKALELDPDLAEAHAGLGMVSLYFDWNWAVAGRQLEKAIELSPSDALIRHGYGDYLLVMGRLGESLEQVELGRRYDPTSSLAAIPVVAHLGFLGRFDEAIDEAQALLEADPGAPMVRTFLASALWARGDYEEAVRVSRESWTGRDVELVEALDRGHRESGPRGAVLAVAEVLARRADEGGSDPLTTARFFTLGGDLESAFEFLARAVELREPGVVHLLADPAYESLRSDPRFDQILEAIGLPST